jgi:hypothetical protein
MEKTSAQEAYYEFLEKRAVSPELARRVLEKATRKMPQMAKDIGGVSPHRVFLDRMYASPRTLSRASSSLNMPGARGSKSDTMQQQLKSLLRDKTNQLGMGHISDETASRILV